MKIYLVSILFLALFVVVAFGTETPQQNTARIEAKIDSLQSLRGVLADSLALTDSAIAGLRGDLAIEKICQVEDSTVFANVCVVGGYAYELPDPTSKKIRVAPQASVRVFGYTQPFFAIEYEGKTLFIEPPYMATNPELERMIVAAEQAEAEKLKKAAREERKRRDADRRLMELQLQKEQERREQARRDKLVKTYGKIVADKILAGEIWIGMSDSLAKESLGSPTEINRRVSAYGVSEQWVYRTLDMYLYFENGTLTSWQE